MSHRFYYPWLFPEFPWRLLGYEKELYGIMESLEGLFHKVTSTCTTTACMRQNINIIHNYLY